MNKYRFNIRFQNYYIKLPNDKQQQLQIMIAMAIDDETDKHTFIVYNHADVGTTCSSSTGNGDTRTEQKNTAGAVIVGRRANQNLIPFQRTG